jgi:ABC-type multidrug transport system ATPase subunit
MQKVAIARALLNTPMLLILDEPTTGLAPRSKREVQTFSILKKSATGQISGGAFVLFIRIVYTSEQLFSFSFVRLIVINIVC